MILRPETPADTAAIAKVNRLAFGQENEGRLVEEIRRGPGFDPRLSLVAEEGGRVIGHILFSPIEILLAANAAQTEVCATGVGQTSVGPRGRVSTSSLRDVSELEPTPEDGRRGELSNDRSVPAPTGAGCPALALAPMAVRPEFQRRGIGSALVRAGLDSARSLGHRVVIVLGHPRYYPRFGFRPARPLGIDPPFPCRDEVFMALELVPGALVGVRGTVRYPPAFDGV